MSKPACSISEGTIKDLYLQRQTPPPHLVAQLLAFQISEFNPKEIILRISDSETFVDCLLVGPYAISDSSIVSTEYSRTNLVFKRYDLIKISDFFCKIDAGKICQLRMIVRKIDDPGSSSPQGQGHGQILGKPEDVSEFVDNGQIKTRSIPAQNNNKLVSRGSEETPIKLEDLGDQPYIQPQNSPNPNRPNQPPQQNPSQADARKQQQPLTLEDIMSGKSGYFIGRLVRLKFGCKQAKDGPMSFLYLGFIDLRGSIVRIHLAGRTALKQSKQLKKGRVYFIKGIELFHGEKVKCGPQIRLKDKQYKIHQIQNEGVKSQYRHEYFCWQHENEWVQSDMVDVIGVLQGIQQKITYKNCNTYQEQRDVVRLSIRNKLKTVKVSFWADHIAIIQHLQLQRKQPILIEDIKKKKSIFLDFIAESNITLLDQDPQLKQKFEELLPPFQEAPEPNNIKELLQVCATEPYSTKMRHLRVKISSINAKWVIYKMCNPCKKKVQKILQNCLQCHQSDFVHRYNCAIELTDSSATLPCVAFDPVCEKLFARSANEFSTLAQEQARELCDAATKEEWKVGIQFKNNRQIIRMVEVLPSAAAQNTGQDHNYHLNQEEEAVRSKFQGKLQPRDFHQE